MARFTKKTKIAIVTTALVFGVSGTAFAYWSQAGAGSGTGTMGDTVAVTVNQLVGATNLYPGVSQPLSGNFTNTNAGAVQVGTVSGAVTATSDVLCLTTWYTVTGTTATQAVPAGTGVGAWTGLSVALTNLPATNQDACKDATITITYAVAAAA